MYQVGSVLYARQRINGVHVNAEIMTICESANIDTLMVHLLGVARRLGLALAHGHGAHLLDRLQLLVIPGLDQARTNEGGPQTGSQRVTYGIARVVVQALLSRREGRGESDGQASVLGVRLVEGAFAI